MWDGREQRERGERLKEERMNRSEKMEIKEGREKEKVESVCACVCGNGERCVSVFTRIKL